MDTFNTKIERITTAKENIKQSLINKGTSPSDNLEDYAALIDGLGNGGSVEGAKIFNSIEEMNGDADAKEGDMAIIYKEEFKNMTATSQTQIITFPETVTLPKAINSSSYTMLRAVDDSSSYFDGQVQLSKTSFRFDGYLNSGSIRVQYTSTDGINYTRTTTDEAIDCGTLIQCYYAEEWNDNFGYFMQVGGNRFDGLFEYGKFKYDANELVRVNKFTDIENTIVVQKPTLVQPTNMSNTEYRYEQIFIHQIEEVSMLNTGEKVYKATDFDVIYSNNGSGTLTVVTFVGDNQGKIYGTVQIPTSTVTNKYFYRQHYSNGELDLEETYDRTNITVPTTKIWYNSDYDSVTISSWGTFEDAYAICYQGYKTTGVNLYSLEYRVYDATIPFSSSETSNYTYLGGKVVTDTKYLVAPTQLDAASKYVYQKVFYGANGVEEGTLQNAEGTTKADLQFLNDLHQNLKTISTTETNLDMVFEGSTYAEFPNMDLPNALTFNYAFARNDNLVTAPNMHTPSATGFTHTFEDCPNLANVPVYNTSSTTSMIGMFTDCPSLTDESLNNILQMCINATNVQNTTYNYLKTLVYDTSSGRGIGLNAEQIERCKTLSNYQAFLNAGWTPTYK